MHTWSSMVRSFHAFEAIAGFSRLTTFTCTGTVAWERVRNDPAPLTPPCEMIGAKSGNALRENQTLMLALCSVLRRGEG